MRNAALPSGGFPSPTDAMPGVLGDIVERHVDPTTGTNAKSPAAGAHHPPPPPLRPIQATAGRAFPALDPARNYGLNANHGAALNVGSVLPSADANRKPQEKRVTFSAHVQPEEGPGSPYYMGKGTPAAASSSENGMLTMQGAAETQFQALAQQLERNPGALPVGGSAGSRAAMARQWSAGDFRALYEGYYTEPLPVNVIAAHAPPQTDAQAACGAPPPAPPPKGEEFFHAIFQCLRSTVRTHQGIALDALCLHLTNTATAQGAQGSQALRERCIHGPDCAPFLFFIMDIMSSAGHPFLCQQAAVCLLLLLQDAKHETALAVIGEMGSPRADVPADEDENDGSGGTEGAEKQERPKIDDDPDLPFSEISEMLRTEGEMRAGLEKMGFTNHVMGAMNTLLFALPGDDTSASLDPHDASAGDGETSSARENERAEALWTLWLSLLLCGGVGESTAVSVRVAADPLFLSRVVEPQLSRVVLGDATLSGTALETPAMTQLLLVLYRLAHIPAALKHMLYGGGSAASPAEGSASGGVPYHHAHHSLYESWTLFFIAICTTRPREGHSTTGVASVMLSLLLLREMARQGYEGVLHDTCTTLFAEGLKVGSALVLEMWTLSLASRQTDEGKDRTSVEHLLRDAARSVCAQLKTEESEGDDANILLPHRSPATVLHESAHGVEERTAEERTVATQLMRTLVLLTNRHFLATYMGTHRMQSFSLLGSTVETQAAMQRILAQSVLRTDFLSAAFARLTGAPASVSTATTDVCGGDSKGLVATVMQWKKTSNVCSKGQLNAHQRKQSLQWSLGLQAALHLANMRLAAAIPNTYPAVDAEAVYGYAAALAVKFQSACLRMRRSVSEALQTDELCTMVEVLAILQRANAQTPVDGLKASSGVTTTAASNHASVSTQASPEKPSYRHEAHVAAVFLLHGIAITKQCLDAAPHAVACVLGLSPDALDGAAVRKEIPNATSDTAAAGVSRDTEKTALAISLLTGVEATPIPEVENSQQPSVSATGTPRVWVLHPLFDDAFPYKACWAAWLRSLLGLHQDMKAVLGWDGLLSHTLLWVLAHRGQLFGPATGDTVGAGDGVAGEADEFDFAEVQSKQNGQALVELLAQLAALCIPSGHAVGTRGDGGEGVKAGLHGLCLSSNSTRVLSVALSDYTNPQAEEGLPPPLFPLLMLVATHCGASAALALAQAILLTPVNADASLSMGKGERMSPLPPSSPSSLPSLFGGSMSASMHRIVEEVLSWPARATAVASQAPTVPELGWGLDSMVGLLQLTGPYLSRSRQTVALQEAETLSAEHFHLWCVHTLTLEVVRMFIATSCKSLDSQTPVLSTMQRTVLRNTLEELDWELEPLWSLVQ